MPDLPDAAAAASAVSARREPGSLSRILWDGSADVFARIVAHPFITGLVDGSLPRDAFVQFLDEDRVYLQAFARSLALLAVKSPRTEWSRLFTGHATEAIAAEDELQEQLLTALGPAPAPPAGRGTPTTLAYTQHLIASCYDGSFLDGLAAILPCYWIYAEIGTLLQAAGSPDPLYRTWIGSYAGEAYGTVVASVLAVVDELGAAAAGAETARALELYRVGSRLEWMFWDAAWRRETWPI